MARRRPVFLTAILLVIAGWMRAEERDEARSDRRADVELAQIRIRERRLAERLAGASGPSRAGRGVGRSTPYPSGGIGASR